AGQDGKPHRIYLTAFMDARSGIFTGYYVTTAPSSYATLLALRKGILEYGIPRNIYVDNGREFLNFDVGGLGHRAKKTYADGKEKFEPPGVFKRLGIEMTNAIVRNARAKIIERRFRDVKDHMSRLFDTYTGGTVVERPDRLKHVMKKGNIVTDEELIQAAEIMIEGYFNHQPYNGSVIEDKGKPRIEVFKENRTTMRKADEESLNLMLQRSTRKQTVGRNGVKIQIAGKTLDFTNDELRTLMGKEVYLRYDPENLNSVRVYDLEDRFLTTAMLKTTLGYGADKDSVQEQMKIIRRAEKATKDALYYSRLPIADKKSAFELVMAAANATREESEQIVDPKIVEWVRVCEEPLLKAVGDIDLNIMTKNARLHRQNETKE
ncbi:MAG: transposase, partial [Oscillospiraceae bacterium]